MSHFDIEAEHDEDNDNCICMACAVDRDSSKGATILHALSNNEDMMQWLVFDSIGRTLGGMVAIHAFDGEQDPELDLVIDHHYQILNQIFERALLTPEDQSFNLGNEIYYFNTTHAWRAIDISKKVISQISG